MKIRDILSILDAELLTQDADLDREVHTACGSDMMSDVLAFVKDQSVLLTGLNNPQVVRTADMMDIRCIALVRGKRPNEDMIAIAKEKGIALISSGHRMYSACGTLYAEGLQPGEKTV